MQISLVVTNKPLIFVSTRNTNTKKYTMTNYELLLEAHGAKNRNVNEVAKYFTLCNNEGMRLKAFDFLGPAKPVQAVWNLQKSHR